MNTNQPFKICQVACRLFTEKGFESVQLTEIAKAFEISESELYKQFGNKQDIVLFLYQCINADWQQQVSLLPKLSLAERFRIATQIKIDLMAPYQDFLGSIIGQLLNNKTISVTAFQTAHIRAMGLKTFELLIADARDAKTLSKRVKDLPSLLYMMHWAALFLHLQTLDQNKTKATLHLLSSMIGKLNSFSLLLSFMPLVNEMSTWANTITADSPSQTRSINNDILKLIFQHRKLVNTDVDCQNNPCATCYDLKELNLSYFTSQDLPIHFILPAFPAKSPNTDKVLGKLPDLGEEIALQTLNTLCADISKIYAPGAHITICSDGRIFSELVGVSDADITAYVAGIKSIIQTEQLKHLDIVNLEDLMVGDSFAALREQVIQQFAEPFENLTQRVKSNEEFKGLFNGMHRFITEDRKFLFPNESTSKIKEESKTIALKVIQHSNAWTRFLNYVFPKSIRLSIHPYPAHAEKIGIQLTKAADNWITPWHGVIVLQEDGYVLMKKTEAIKKQARLISKNNTPYYYSLIHDASH